MDDTEGNSTFQFLSSIWKLMEPKFDSDETVTFNNLVPIVIDEEDEDMSKLKKVFKTKDRP